MSTIFYGGTKSQVEKQLKCNHDWNWTGLNRDEISRYYKCTKCYCMDRDCTESEFYETLKEVNNLP